LQDFKRRLAGSPRHSEAKTGLNSFFEGVVLKRLVSPFPVQRLNPERETPASTKHRSV
jgi:hypothetical protein